MAVVTVIIVIEKKLNCFCIQVSQAIEGGEQKEAFSINLYICALLVARFSSCSSILVLLLTFTPPLLLVTLLCNYYNIYSLYMFKVQTK